METEIRNRGNKITTFPNSFTIIDLETTGFSPKYDSIIEFGAIKVRDNNIVDTYHTLINPKCLINDFITNLTGITNSMFTKKPTIDEEIDNIIGFISDDIVVGHNVNFDVNFIYDNLQRLRGIDFSNDYLDTMRFSRKIHKDLKHHRLFDLIELYNIEIEREHRALEDCYSTFEIFYKLKADALSKFGSFENFSNSFKKVRKATPDFTKLESTNFEFDISHPLYEKECVFTGTLEKMKRIDAAQLVVNLGGTVGNSVTKKTNFLVLGNNDYCKSIKDGKSNKQKKAEDLIQKGNDLTIISEDVFYDLIIEGDA